MPTPPPLLPTAPAEDPVALSSSTTSSFTLRIKELPSVLSNDAVTSLLSHYGASRVRVLHRKKRGAAIGVAATETKLSQVAIAEFPDHQRLLDAQQRLARIQLAGKKLIVEVVQCNGQNGSIPTTASTVAATPTTIEQTPSVASPAPLDRPREQPPTRSSRRAAKPNTPAAAPLAPHLGLHYAPSPLLTYKYPKATVPVVRNIANALMALPRFYTQVLHLMNKMNLPTPFEPNAIPGVFAGGCMVDARQQLSQETGAPHHDQVVEEDDEEDEAEEEEEEHTNSSIRQDQVATQSVKRLRTDSITRTGAGFATTNSPHTNKKQRRLSSSKQPAFTVFNAGGIPGVSERDATLKSPRAGVISAAELNCQRLPSHELARDPVFAGYTPGRPHRHVCISNLAESVDAKDLEFVFGHALPLDTPLASLAIVLEPSTASALVSFPSLQSAQRALELCHGVVLDGRPMVVRYHEPLVPVAPVPATTPSSLESIPVPPPPARPPQPSNNNESLEPDQLKSTTEWQKMEPALLAQEKAMKNYQRGEPSHALYLKNLAKSVNEAALRSLCRSFLPASVPTESLSVRHFTEGRMKNQAFLEFPSVAVASAVLDQIHGLVLSGKPLVVTFRKATAPAPSPAPALVSYCPPPDSKQREHDETDERVVLG